jgi:hypothetical protein
MSRCRINLVARHDITHFLRELLTVLQDAQAEIDTYMDVQTSQTLAEATPSREPPQSATPPPSERTQPTSTHEDQNMDAQSPEQTKPQAVDMADMEEVTALDTKRINIGMIEKPLTESLTLSPIPAEAPSRTPPDISKCSSYTPICG